VRVGDAILGSIASCDKESVIKKTVILFFPVLFATVVVAGCAGTWMSQPIESFRPPEEVPPSSVCQPCHQDQFDAWKRTRHSEDTNMAKIPVMELHECGACHADLNAHAADPQGKRPPRVAMMTKTEKNSLCGKCHYNQKLFGSRAINPHGKHSLFANVALEGQPKQIACLDCHSGHKGKSDMLVRIKAHICYKCHMSAMVTMGILFQVPNWLTAGYMCQACHTVHGGSDSERWGRMSVGFCVVCHFVGVAIVGG
jgi:predicted CXXCH cytochrome family protein